MHAHTRARACIHIDAHTEHTLKHTDRQTERERRRHRHREARSNNNQPNTITQPVQKEKWNESEHFLDSVKSEGIYHSLNITGNKWQWRCNIKPKRDRQTDRQKHREQYYTCHCEKLRAHFIQINNNNKKGARLLPKLTVVGIEPPNLLILSRIMQKGFTSAPARLPL